ncbi:MAG: hypothetical protein L3K14_09155 [Thermoplasmata archaeon]|nr:hypothetical protein [Thermoplasmata archaeon]
MAAATDSGSLVAVRGRPSARPLEEIPGELGRSVLLLEFFALALYWITPALYSSWNYAGTWSDLGYVLFVPLMATLSLAVLRPLPAHLARVWGVRRNRLLFHGLWSGTLVAGLVATSLIQFSAAGASAGSGAPLLQWTTTYTPFGAWPGISIDLASAGVFIAINPPILALLGVVSVLWAAVVVLRLSPPSLTCTTPPAPAKGWRSKVATLAAWGPVGFISGCPACSPAYLALVGLVAPGTAAAGYAAEPLVPWIGLAGLLFLGSLGLTLLLLRRITASVVEALRPDEAEVGAE